MNKKQEESILEFEDNITQSHLLKYDILERQWLWSQIYKPRRYQDMDDWTVDQTKGKFEVKNYLRIWLKFSQMRSYKHILWHPLFFRTK